MARRTARPGAGTSPGPLAAREKAGDPTDAATDTEHPGTGHHDRRHHGSQGRRTATTERAPALVSVPGSASAREQERRAAASNIPDSVSYFVSPNGPTTGPRRAPAIAQPSHNFMEGRLPGGIPDFPFRRPRGRPIYDNAVFMPLSERAPYIVRDHSLPLTMSFIRRTWPPLGNSDHRVKCLPDSRRLTASCTVLSPCG